MGRRDGARQGIGKSGGFRGNSRGKQGGHLRARFGSFSLDTDTHQLERDGAAIHLTPKAFDLLALLIHAAPRVVAKSELHETLWPGVFVSDATLVGLVKEVRRALGDQRRGTVIRTVHRVGYAFSGRIEPDQSRSGPALTPFVLQGSARIPLREGKNFIGRDPQSTVWVDAAGVSRRHACIVVEAGSATLEDLGSKNGTMCGDRLVTAPVTLRDSDRIMIANVVLVFRAASSVLSTETVLREGPDPL